ncbi:MAG: DUF1566 domain-containing protein [Deltaproteobacteria bacterium]|nr:MAG: DUF1566 domain-containing protein [Deltaproteobacteria bacterium]
MKDMEMLALRVKSKHMLMLFDSCFSGSLFALARTAPTDITEKSVYPVRQFITAGGADETVPDRSIFKICLLRGLDGEADFNGDNYVTASELGMYLQTKVVNYSNGAQHPQYGKINNPHLDRGDFILVPHDTELTSLTDSLTEATALLSGELERLRQERERLAEELRILEEQQRLRAESQRLAEEQRKLAYIPESVTSPRVSLRKEPEKLKESNLKNMLEHYDFFDRFWRSHGNFESNLIDNGDGTVTDKATGLMWQKSGSKRSRTRRGADYYIGGLNKDAFAGYSDWRLPTIEELASLLKKNKTNGLHIDGVFDDKQERCWSADEALEGGSVISSPEDLSGGWVVSFSDGRIQQAWWQSPSTDQDYAFMYERTPSNYVRAVRNLKQE